MSVQFHSFTPCITVTCNEEGVFSITEVDFVDTYQGGSYMDAEGMSVEIDTADEAGLAACEWVDSIVPALTKAIKAVGQ